MTRVDFAHGAPDRLKTACQVVHRHYLAGHTVVVYASDPGLLTRFDRLLWAFEPTAFVPHAMDTDDQAATSPVVLTSSTPAQFQVSAHQTPRWLLNLDPACPPDAQAFDRVLEIVSHHDDDKACARKRWMAYREAGFELRAHQLDTIHAG